MARTSIEVSASIRATTEPEKIATWARNGSGAEDVDRVGVDDGGEQPDPYKLGERRPAADAEKCDG
jgi:hypothetical protein